MASGVGYRGIWFTVSYEEGRGIKEGFQIQTECSVKGCVCNQDQKFVSGVECTVMTTLHACVFKNREFYKGRGVQSVWSRAPGAGCRV